MEEVFSDSNVTVTLNYQAHQTESIYGTLLNASIEVTPQTIVVSNGTHVELVLLYNVLYNISFFVSLCGLTGPSITEQLFYGK